MEGSDKKLTDVESIRAATVIQPTEVTTFERLNKQTTKALSDWHETAKKAKEERELKECTFAPQISARKPANNATAVASASVTGVTVTPANERLYKMRKN